MGTWDRADFRTTFSTNRQTWQRDFGSSMYACAQLFMTGWRNGTFCKTDIGGGVGKGVLYCTLARWVSAVWTGCCYPFLYLHICCTFTYISTFLFLLFTPFYRCAAALRGATFRASGKNALARKKAEQGQAGRRGIRTHGTFSALL